MAPTLTPFRPPLPALAGSRIPSPKIGSTRYDLLALDRYERVLDTIFDSVVAVDEAGSIVAMNRAAEELFGYRKESAIGKRFDKLLIPEQYQERHRAGVSLLVETRDSPILNSRMEAQARRSDGTEITVELTVTLLEDAPMIFMAVIRDLSQEKRQLRQLEELSKENAQILASAGDGIVRYDLEGRMTYVNPAAAELVGSSVADLIGMPLHTTIHHSHADGRHYPASECPVMGALHGGICHVTSEVFWRVDGTYFPVDYTGAPIREDGEIVGAVCVFADITEERAREEHLREQTKWSARIHRGLRDELFVMHSQPIVDIGTREPVMHELLIRMHSEDGGFLGPGGFLPQAAQFDLMGDIDRWVVAEALRIARDRPVTINISAQSLTDIFFTSWAQRAIEESGAPPQNLLFEIAETAALKDFDLACQLVLGLTEMGCGFALDDFGTGFGSFTDLKHLPVTHLKIDITFVRDLSRNENNRRIVASIVSLAKSFGMRTIAKGVEEEAPLELLSELGVDYAQGYFLGRPVPLDD